MADQVTAVEEGVAAARAPKSGSGGLILGFGIALLVVMIIEGVVFYTLFVKPEAVRTGATTPWGVQEEGRLGGEDLAAPSLEVPDVITFVKVDTAGNKLRNLIVTVSIKLGRDQVTPEAKLDLKQLEKEYLPKAEAFIPEFKHMLIEELNKRDYAKLQDMEEWRKMLDELKNRCNDRLGDYGLKPRIAGIYVQTFSFD